MPGERRSRGRWDLNRDNETCMGAGSLTLMPNPESQRVGKSMKALPSACGNARANTSALGVAVMACPMQTVNAENGLITAPKTFRP